MCQSLICVNCRPCVNQGTVLPLSVTDYPCLICGLFENVYGLSFVKSSVSSRLSVSTTSLLCYITSLIQWILGFPLVLLPLTYSRPMWDWRSALLSTHPNHRSLLWTFMSNGFAWLPTNYLMPTCPSCHVICSRMLAWSLWRRWRLYGCEIGVSFVFVLLAFSLLFNK